MPLNDLTLDQLEALLGQIGQLHDIGCDIVDRNLTPVFSVSLDNPVVATIRFILPPPRRPQTCAEAAKLYIPSRSTEAASFLADAIDDVAADLRQPEPVDAPLAAEGLAEGATLSAADQSRSDAAEPPQVSAPSEVEAESGGGQVVAAAEPPAAPTPGSASALAASTLAVKPWTEVEDDQLIGMIVGDVIGHGQTMAAAIRTAARWLDRPEQGTAFRCRNKLKARLDNALAAARAAKAEAEELLARSPEAAQKPLTSAEALPEQVAPERGGDAAVGAPTPAAVQDLDAKSRDAAIAHGTHPASFIADPVTAHLMGLTDKGGWTLDRDLELMELSIAGWQPNEIALQLQMQASAIKLRFDTLTGLYQDDNGKKARRFAREDVYAALQRLAGKAA